MRCVDGTVPAYFTGGGELDGTRMNLPADLTTYWVGSIRSAWATELGAAPENVVGPALKCYEFDHVRVDGTRVFVWVTPSAAH
jgi:hypothetical protein